MRSLGVMAVGAEMAILGRSMRKNQAAVKAGNMNMSVNDYTEELPPEPEEKQYIYEFYEKAVVSFGDSIASMLELIFLNDIKVPKEVMKEAMHNLEMIQWALNLDGKNNYEFGIKASEDQNGN
jgi:hypothetical protein